VITTSGNDIVFANNINGLNLGTGSTIFTSKTIAGLIQLKSFETDPTVGSEGISITSTLTTLRIGNTLTASNIGTGTGLVFSAKSAGAILQLRSLIANVTAGSEGITISTSGNNIVIGDALTASNPGTAGQGTIFISKTSGALLQLRSLITSVVSGSEGTVISNSGNDIVFANNISGLNLGTGSTIFTTKTVAGLIQLKSFEIDPAAGNEGISVSSTLTTLRIGNTMTASNPGTAGQGTSFISKTVGASLQFRSLITSVVSGSEGTVITNSGNDIVFANNINASNLGTGQFIFTSKTAAGLIQLRSITFDPASGSEGLSVNTTLTSISIGNTLTAGNIGTGTGLVFSAKSAGAILQLRSLIADATAGNEGIVVTTSGNNIIIGNTITASNPGTAGQGTSFISKTAGALLQFRSLITSTVSGSEGTVIANSGSDVVFANNINGSNLGTGQPIFVSKTTAGLLQLRTLEVDPTAGSGGISINTTTTTLQLGNTMNMANTGSGTGFLAAGRINNTLQIRTLIGDSTAGNEGTTALTSGNLVILANTINGSNLGAGSQIFTSKTSGGLIQLRSLIADPTVGNEGIVMSTTTTTLQIGNTMTASNPGTAGQGTIFISKTTGAALQLRSLITSVVAGSEGTVIANSGNDIVFANNINGSNLGAGSQIFTSKTAAGLIQLRSLIADPTVGNEGIVMSTTTTTLQIGNTMTAANLGAGNTLFTSKSAGAALQFKSIAAGPGISITTTVSQLNINNVQNTWVISDEKASGSQGGAISAATTLRALNTIVSAGINTSNVILGTDQFTMQPGTYLISARAPCYRGSENRIALFNATSNALIFYGQSSFSEQTNNGPVTTASLERILIVIASTTYQIRHFITTNNGGTQTLGRATSIAGSNEVYTTVTITQVV
jgi:hypothetical protein